LLVNLFENPKLITAHEKILAKLKGRNCDILEDLSFYQEEVAASGESTDKSYHINSVLENMNKERRYKEYFGKIADSHIEIEKLGVCKYAKPYTTIVSLEDSLDYILHRLCKAEVSNIRSIPNYFEVSRAILKLNYKGMEGLNFNWLMNADGNLARFLVEMHENTNDDSDNRAGDFVHEFINRLIQEVSHVTEYISFYYNTLLERDSSVIRSKSFCSFVISTDKKLDDVLYLRSAGFEDYAIRVRSFERKEYLHSSELRYVE
jgi:hypothetical protein